MQLSTNYGLKLPEGTDNVKRQDFIDNFSKIDSVMKEHDTHLSELTNDRIYYCGTTSGTNTYTAANNKITVYTEGLTVRVKIGNASTGASTLNINGLGAKTILDSLGNAITGGGLKSGLPYQLCYNGTNFIVLGKGGGGDAIASQLLINKKATVDTGPIVGTMPDNGGVSSTLTNNNQEYTIPAGFHNGLGKIKAIIINLAAAVIKAGTTVGGIVGTFTSDATAVAADIINGKTAYVNGNKITGNATIESLGGLACFQGSAILSSTATTAAFNLGFTPTVALVYCSLASGRTWSGTWISSCGSNSILVRDNTNGSSYAGFTVINNILTITWIQGIPGTYYVIAY